MKIRQSEAEKLLAEWAEIERQRYIPLQPDEVSQKQYGRMIGASADRAAITLEGYVKAGTWTKRDAMINGKRGIAYKPKGKPKK